MRNELKKALFHHAAVTLLVVFWLWAGPVTAEEPGNGFITLDEAVRMALEQNLGLKAQEQELGIARGELFKAKVFVNPELELSGEKDALLANEGEGRYSVGLGQTLFVGPKRRYRIGIGELNLGRTQKAIENTQRLLVAEVKDSFMPFFSFRRN